MNTTGAFLAASGTTTGSNPVEVTLVTIGAILFYWLPSLIGWRRHVPALGQVIVVNFFGFFFLIPWIIALVMAFREPRRSSQPAAD